MWLKDYVKAWLYYPKLLKWLNKNNIPFRKVSRCEYAYFIAYRRKDLREKPDYDVRETHEFEDEWKPVYMIEPIEKPKEGNDD